MGLDASSAESRVDVLVIACSAVLLLTGLQWLAVRAQDKAPVRHGPLSKLCCRLIFKRVPAVFSRPTELLLLASALKTASSLSHGFFLLSPSWRLLWNSETSNVKL